MRRLAAALVLIAAVAVTDARADVMDLLGRRVTDVRVFADGLPVTDRSAIELVETRLGSPLRMADVRQTIDHFVTLGRYADIRVFAEPEGTDDRLPCSPGRRNSTFASSPSREPSSPMPNRARSVARTRSWNRRITMSFVPTDDPFTAAAADVVMFDDWSPQRTSASATSGVPFDEPVVVHCCVALGAVPVVENDAA